MTCLYFSYKLAVRLRRCRALTRSSVSVELQMASYICLISRRYSISTVSTSTTAPVDDLQTFGCDICRMKCFIFYKIFVRDFMERTLWRRRRRMRSLTAEDLLELSSSISWNIMRWLSSFSSHRFFSIVTSPKRIIRASTGSIVGLLSTTDSASELVTEGGRGARLSWCGGFSDIHRLTRRCIMMAWRRQYI